MATIRVTVWDENPPHVDKAIYPTSIRGAVAEGLAKLNDGTLEIRTAHLDEPEQGCSLERLRETDVLIWWGHIRHGEVSDETAERIRQRVHHEGMGLLVLHSGHYSKPFQRVLGCTGHLKGGWREKHPAEPEHVRVCAPQHPIAQGVEDFVIEHEEMYGAPFDVPPPLVVVFQSYFPDGGEYFPTGLCWTVGDGIDPNFTSGPGRRREPRLRHRARVLLPPWTRERADLPPPDCAAHHLQRGAVVREADGLIDLRSDTVTKPTPAMRRAMAEAAVGDDVLGDDPTVQRLQEAAAQRVGKQAALFVPSGVMANLVSLMTLTGRNEEVIVGDQSHLYTAEVGGLGIFGNVFLHVLPNLPDGTIPLERLQGAIRDAVYTPKTRVISLESTHNRCGGAALPLDYIQQVAAVAQARGVALHLDGARIFNAAIALGVPAEAIAAPFEVVNFCFSKGLGAPVGSIVCGSAAFIQEAKRTRRMLGGGMRQAGVLAAACLVALETMVERLAEDHAHARMLADGLANIRGIRIDPARVQTNIVIFEVDPATGWDSIRLQQALAERGVLLSLSGTRLRAVTHYHITRTDIMHALAVIQETLDSSRRDL
jgi:threonine aldolase